MRSLARVLEESPQYDPNVLPVAAARAIIDRYVSPIRGFERVSVRAALGRVLSEDVVSTIDVPTHDNSAMDGYAVRHAGLDASGESRLRIVGTALAGRRFDAAVNAGEAVRIMTGAVMPSGTDTVVVQEVVRLEGEEVIVPAGQKRTQNTRRAGEDLKAGAPALVKGQLVRPAELGILASMGLAEVTVKPRIRVAFFSTGDELASVGTPLMPGQVYDSNRYTLYGMLARLNCEPLDLGVIRDSRECLEEALAIAAGKADAIITTGGVSVGEADFIRELLARLGEVAFWKIAMKPGRPMAFGRIGQAYFFGLPGNPVAVMVTFYEFVREALLKLMGRGDHGALPTLAVPCQSRLKKAPGRTEYQRGVLAQSPNGIWEVRITGAQGSGILHSMSEANCLIVLVPEQTDVEPGDLVRVQVLEGLV